MILFEAYQLNARLKHLLLVGQDDAGDLQWMEKTGTYGWADVTIEESKYENN